MIGADVAALFPVKQITKIAVQPISNPCLTPGRILRALNVCIVGFSFFRCFWLFALSYDLLLRTWCVGSDDGRRFQEGGH